MAEATLKQTADEWPDISGIVTEDDTPVDNLFSEKQQRLLTDSLNSSWKPGRSFLSAADVGIFYDPDEPPIVPDVFMSLDVTAPEDKWKETAPISCGNTESRRKLLLKSYQTRKAGKAEKSCGNMHRLVCAIMSFLTLRN